MYSVKWLVAALSFAVPPSGAGGKSDGACWAQTAVAAKVPPMINLPRADVGRRTPRLLALLASGARGTDRAGPELEFPAERALGS